MSTIRKILDIYNTVFDWFIKLNTQPKLYSHEVEIGLVLRRNFDCQSYFYSSHLD